MVTKLRRIVAMGTVGGRSWTDVLLLGVDYEKGQAAFELDDGSVLYVNLTGPKLEAVERRQANGEVRFDLNGLPDGHVEIVPCGKL